MKEKTPNKTKSELKSNKTTTKTLLKEKTATTTTLISKHMQRLEKNKIKRTYNINKLQMFATIFVVCFLMFLLSVDSSDAIPVKKRRIYSLRRGGRLERHHRRSLNEWVNAAKHLDGEEENFAKKHPRHSHRHKKKIPKIHKMDLDQILKQMDSIVRPRFGR